jgi:hypothetical protein
LPRQARDHCKENSTEVWVGVVCKGRDPCLPMDASRCENSPLCPFLDEYHHHLPGCRLGASTMNTEPKRGRPCSRIISHNAPPPLYYAISSGDLAYGHLPGGRLRGWCSGCLCCPSTGQVWVRCSSSSSSSSSVQCSAVQCSVERAHSRLLRVCACAPECPPPVRFDHPDKLSAAEYVVRMYVLEFAH